jgi:maleate isomerase
VTRPEYGWQGRVGLIVPPANVTLEPEMAAMLPPGVSLHVTRLPGRVSNDTSVGLRERFLGYNSSLSAAADSFGGADLSAVCLGVTGSCYMLGPGGEESLLTYLRAGGAPHVITAARAISELLRTLGCRRIALLAPYPEWLTKLATVYWQTSGFKVVQVVTLPDVVSIYDVDTNKVVAAANKLRESGAEVILLSGTGVPTLPAISKLDGLMPVPVISSNLSLGWWLRKTLSVSQPLDAMPPALVALHRWLRPEA